MIITFNPETLPSAPIPCLYLFHDNKDRFKIGRSVSLRNRAVEYKARGFVCLGYISPVLDLDNMEKAMIRFFGDRFGVTLYANKHRSEWMRGNRYEAMKGLTDWFIEMHRKSL